MYHYMLLHWCPTSGSAAWPRSCAVIYTITYALLHAIVKLELHSLHLDLVTDGEEALSCRVTCMYQGCGMSWVLVHGVWLPWPPGKWSVLCHWLWPPDTWLPSCQLVLVCNALGCGYVLEGRAPRRGTFRLGQDMGFLGVRGLGCAVLPVVLLLL